MTTHTPLADTIRQMIADWNAATPEQREEALRLAAERAARAEAKLLATVAH